jgi:PKD repeat protein
MRRSYNFILIVFILSIILSACQKEPTAEFASSKSIANIGEMISFINTSKDADSYEWNFGDGGISTETNSSHSFNTGGIYNVSLKVFSKNGKKSDEAIVSITITNTADITPPVITLIGANPTNIILGTTYTDAGATANDDVDGDLTSSIVCVNNVNNTLKGSYNVNYSVYDAAGNSASINRTVNVKNAADAWDGSYNASDDWNSDGTIDYTWTETITSSSTINYQLSFLHFAYYTGVYLKVNVSGSSLSYPGSQTFMSGPSGMQQNRTFSNLAGNITATTLTISYHEVDADSFTTDGVDVYVKQ